MGNGEKYRAPALEGWNTGCGAQLKSRMQSHAKHINEGEAARKAAENAAMAAAFAERMAKAAQNAGRVAEKDGFCLECWRNALEQRRRGTAL
jgi:hypothetical protein